MRCYPHGTPRLHGLFKSCPEDFIVVEELGFKPDGQGTHSWLLVEKRAISTPQLIDRIAADFQLKTRDIGYSGLKDRQAIARQWVSIPLVDSEMPRAFSQGYRILERHFHPRKLRRGSHRENYFEVCLRQVNDFSTTAKQQLETVLQSGFANFFGEQRFGRQQDNVEQALISLTRPRLARWRKGLLISALRSYLFNEILARRIELGLWHEPVEGDVFMLSGSHSIFTESVDDAIRKRFSNLDIASTASLYGSGPCLLQGLALEIEQEVLAAHPDITRCLDQQGAKRQMRALRATVRKPGYAYLAESQTLKLQLSLPAGSYVTSLLDHCLNRGDSSLMD